MEIDRKRITQYLYEIQANTEDLNSILNEFTDEKLIENKRLLKSIKFSLVEIAETISLIIQHILAKKYLTPVKGYIDTINKAYEKGIIDQDIYNSLKPFFDFRNTLIHRYWDIKEEVLIRNLRENLQKFYEFTEAIRKKFLQ